MNHYHLSALNTFVQKSVDACMNTFSLTDFENSPQKVALVTGANIGLGYQTTRAFAAKEIEVVMACRNLEKAQAARQQILAEIPSAKLKVMVLDLADLESVKTFAAEFMAQYSQLDLLVNNAGLMMPPRQTTKQGYEIQFGVNYLAHFLLTSLLLPTMEHTPHSRIVSLASMAHRWGDLYFDDLNWEKSYHKQKSYGQSKLACLMFGYELDRRLKQKGSSVLSVIAHPGVSLTNLMQYVPQWMQGLLGVMGGLFASTPEHGARPIVLASLSPKAKGGQYYGPTGFNEMKGEPGVVDSNAVSKDQEKAAQLWEVSQQLLNIKFFS